MNPVKFEWIARVRDMGGVRMRAKEYIHERLRSGRAGVLEDRMPAANESVLGELQAHGLPCKGMASMYLHPHGEVTVHRVRYHEGQPDIVAGYPRAHAGAHANGWYAVICIRTVDREPDWEMVQRIGAGLGIAVAPDSTAHARDARVVVVLNEVEALGLRFYSVSMTGGSIAGFRAGMDKVNRVAYELLCEKEIKPREMDDAEGIRELVNSLTDGV